MTKTLLFLGALALAGAGHAQSCMVIDYDEPNGTAGWLTAPWSRLVSDGYADGSTVAVMREQFSLGHAVVARISQMGEPIWTKRLDPTNTLVDLKANHILACADGGALVLGRTEIWVDVEHSAHFGNYFGIRLDAQGEIVWARYYMHEVPQLDIVNFISSAELPNGDIVLGLSHATGYDLVRLDGTGTPLWDKRHVLTITAQPDYGCEAMALRVADNGDLVLAGKASGNSFLMRANASGELIWSKVWDSPLYYATDLALYPSGDILVTFIQQVMRLGADGTIQWTRSYGNNHHYIFTLPNGGFMTASNSGNFTTASPAGLPIGGWNDIDQNWTSALTGVVQDTVRYLINSASGPRCLRAHYTDLTCFSNASVPTSSAIVPVELAHTMETVEDTLKTWTMAFGGSTEMNELDLEVALASGFARPGFEFNFQGTVYNTRGQTSGPVTAAMTFDPALNYVSATPTPDNVSGNTITWTMPAIAGFEYESLSARFQVPVAVPLGTPLSTSLAVSQDSTEINLDNNTAIRQQVVVGSYDPNMKEVTPADVYIVEQDSVLQYVIHFQNTGTDTAFNVVLTDTLPPQVHASTFKAGPATHPYTYTLNGEGILNFHFANILLPDSNTNEPLSHGFVSFTIKLDETLLLGTVISNAADIFFDFNEPVRTNSADVVLGLVTRVEDRQAPELKVFPVPAREWITLGLPEGFVPERMILTAPDGRLVWDKRARGSIHPLAVDIRDLETGTYHITLRNKDGQGVTARFVKE